MKIYYLFFALLIFAGCSSSKNNGPIEYQNLVKLQEPGNTPHQTAKVYIDSVETLAQDSEKAILIYGTFPDACTHIGNAAHKIENNEIQLNITAWRNPEQMCAQVLTPFEYIYSDIPGSIISDHSKIFINGSAYNY